MANTTFGRTKTDKIKIARDQTHLLLSLARHMLDWKCVNGKTKIKGLQGKPKLMMIHNAVKFSLAKITTKSFHVPVIVNGILTHVCACTRIPCAPRLRGLGRLHSDSIYKGCCFACEHIFKHPPLPSLPVATVNSA